MESEGRLSRESTFRSAVTTAKAKTDSDGYVKPSTGFGANFVAPQRRGLASSTTSTTSTSSSRSTYQRPTSNRTPQRTILVKSAANKKREQERIDAFMKDNAIKRMAEERRQRQEAQRLEAEQKEREREQSKFIEDTFEVGQRVFHDKMGIGHITDVMNIGESIMYTIDFGKLGKKAMDASYAKLKKF